MSHFAFVCIVAYSKPIACYTNSLRLLGVFNSFAACLGRLTVVQRDAVNVVCVCVRLERSLFPLSCCCHISSSSSRLSEDVITCLVIRFTQR